MKLTALRRPDCAVLGGSVGSIVIPQHGLSNIVDIFIREAIKSQIMPTVQADSHRGKVCQALSTHDWMDCYDVAGAIGYTVEGTSKVLADVYRAGYVNRRETKEREEVDYEYQLKTNVSVD